ncbi:MAG TPA: hypothetical protein PLF40_09685 [Kofleriaceae bacterium]|nr:hypothetical protein [Kofleriaceae bacterium]
MLALDWTALAFAAAVLFSALTLMWLLSVRIRNVSIVDIAWAPAFTLFNGSYAWRHWQHEVAVPLRAYLVLAVLMLWGAAAGQPPSGSPHRPRRRCPLHRDSPQ